MRPLSDFPRIELAHRPTPLEPMPNLSRLLGGPSLLVKRDDCTGLAMGGNKVRQLEFYFGDAVEKGATTVLITGAVQSNYVRTVAAAAAKLGLGCHIQLEDRVPGMGEVYHGSGNVLLDRLLGAHLHTYPEGEDEAGADRALAGIAAKLKERGERPYLIYLSEEHEPLGALGYVDAAAEIMRQAEQMQVSLTTIVLASGGGATHAGMLVGLRDLGRDDIAVHGICVRRGRDAQRERIVRVVRKTEELLDCVGVVRENEVLVNDDFLGTGYGRPTESGTEAMLLVGRTEGLLLDPVYTGKAFAGFLDLVRRGAVGSEPIVFLHTGGTPALFAYGPEVLEAVPGVEGAVGS